MIPRVAFFHWQGRPMNWLRRASIATFERHNPDWEIRIVRTDPDIAQLGLQHGQAADWTWYRRLWREGGFQFATDIVFVAPVPEEWLQGNLSLTTGDSDRVWQCAGMGAAQGSPFFSEADEDCARAVCVPDRSALPYQALGVNLLRRLPIPPGTFRIPIHALCPVPDDATPTLWDPEWRELEAGTIGVHWYGGHLVSADLEWKTPRDSYIVQLAERELDSGGGLA